MPLLDHFRPPLSQRRHWDSSLAAWAEAIALNLNQSLLPERFVAEARVKLGGQVEIDVGTFAEQANGPPSGAGGVAVWAPPKPTATAALDFQDPDVFEVQVLSDEEGPRLVAAIELVSPANKDRPANRRMFAVKCASYLHSGVSVIMVDVVTERPGNLYAELLELLQMRFQRPAKDHKIFMRRPIAPRRFLPTCASKLGHFPFHWAALCLPSRSGCNPTSVCLWTWTQPTTRLVWLDGLILERRQ